MDSVLSPKRQHSRRHKGAGGPVVPDQRQCVRRGRAGDRGGGAGEDTFDWGKSESLLASRAEMPRADLAGWGARFRKGYAGARLGF